VVFNTDWSDTFSASPEDMEQSIAQVIVPFILCAIPLTVKRPIQEVKEADGN